MSSKVKNFIKNLDQFGVVFKPSIFHESEYKTLLGGALSIIIYGASLGFFIYQFVLWKNGGMLPKITLSSQVITDQSVYFEEPLFSLQMRSYGENSVDPFDPENLILLPIMLPIVNGIYSNQPLVPKINKNESDQFTKIYFDNFTLAISSEKSINNPSIDISIVIVDCVQSLMQSGMNCANTTTRKQFFSQSINSLYFTTFIKQFNAQEEAINTFASQIVLALDSTTAYYATNTLKLQEAIVDDGILFENIYQRDFILDVSTSAQQLNSQFFQGVLNSTTYFINNYQLNGIKSVQYIQYSKLNEVLANVGSIVSLLLLTSVLVIMANQYWLINEALDKVIGMYYPNLKNIKYNKNWYGKIMGIEYQGKQLDIQKFKYNYGKFKEIAQVKLTITNQIYEISRIQFILQSQLKRNQFKYSHFIGIKEHNFIENSKLPEIDNDFSILKETKIVYFIFNQQPLNQLKADIQSAPNENVQQNHSNNSALEIQSDNEQNGLLDKNIDELCDEDFELLIQKQRTMPKHLSQFYEINKII